MNKPTITEIKDCTQWLTKAIEKTLEVEQKITEVQKEKDAARKDLQLAQQSLRDLLERISE